MTDETIDTPQAEEPVAAVETTSEATTEEVKETAAEESAEPKAETDKPAKTSWVQARIDQLTKEKYEAQRARDSMAAEIASLREGRTDTPPADIEKLVDQRANERVAEQKFNDDCNRVHEEGTKAFKDFDETLGQFRMLGGLPAQVLEVATKLPNSHKVLYALGKDLDEASRIMSLPPVQMAVELTKLSLEPAKVRPVSSAPEPIRPIAGGGAVVNKDPKDMNMQEYTAWRQKSRA